jgi:hypothetical protein
MPYIPEHRFQGNLYTNGSEYILLSNGELYQGSYYKLSSGKYYTGKNPYINITQEIIPIPQSDPNAFVDDYILNQSTLKLGGFGFLNSAITTNYITLFNIDENITYFVPQPSIPIPTSEDYTNGTFIRYILFNTVTKSYLEVNKNTYENILNKDAAWDYFNYQAFTLPWRISGTKEEITQTNTKMIVVVSRKNNLPNLSLYLVNLYEFSKLEIPDIPYTYTITYVEPEAATPVVS